MSPRSLEVRHDKENDIHLVTPRWRIETREDCVAWAGQYRSTFEPLGRPVDVIISLGDFHIGKGIGPVWGTFRAEMVRRYFRFSVRVNADAKVSTFVATSGAIHHASYDEARDIPSATELIKLLRAKG